MEFLFAWLFFSILIAVLASSRGRSGFWWFLLSLILSPLICLVLILVMSNKAVPPGPTPETHVKCPDCRELVLKDARVCKHCGCKLVPQ